MPGTDLDTECINSFNWYGNSNFIDTTTTATTNCCSDYLLMFEL